MTELTFLLSPTSIRWQEPDEEPPQITADEIIETVCDYFKIDIHKILTKSRRREIVQARQVTAFFLRIKTTLSLKDIGEAVHQDHTTVMHSIWNVRDLASTENPYFQNIMNINGLLGGGEISIDHVETKYKFKVKLKANKPKVKPVAPEVKRIEPPNRNAWAVYSNRSPYGIAK